MEEKKRREDEKKTDAREGDREADCIDKAAREETLPFPAGVPDDRL